MPYTAVGVLALKIGVTPVEAIAGTNWFVFCGRSVFFGIRLVFRHGAAVRINSFR